MTAVPPRRGGASVDAPTAAQIMSLRAGGMIVADIAERLNLPLGTVQIALKDEPRRFKRGPESAPGPSHRRAGSWS
jgi:hypothetical protein